MFIKMCLYDPIVDDKIKIVWKAQQLNKGLSSTKYNNTYRKYRTKAQKYSTRKKRNTILNEVS